MSIQFNTEKNWKIYAGQIISGSNNGDTAQINIGDGKIQFTGDFHFTEPDSQNSNRFIKMDNMQLIEFNDIFNDQNIVRDNRLNLHSDFNDVGNHRVNNVLQIKSLFELPRSTILSFNNSSPPDNHNTFINFLSLLAKRDPFFDRLMKLFKDTDYNNYKNNINKSLDELYSLYDYPKEDRIYNYVGNLFFTSEIMFDARNLIFDTTKTDLENDINNFNTLINDNTGQRNGTLDLLFDYTTLYSSNTVDINDFTYNNNANKLYNYLNTPVLANNLYKAFVNTNNLNGSLSNVLVLDNLYNFIGIITTNDKFLEVKIFRIKNQLSDALGNETLEENNGVITGELMNAHLLLEFAVNDTTDTTGTSYKEYYISKVTSEGRNRPVHLNNFTATDYNIIELNGAFLSQNDEAFASNFEKVDIH